ncbi:hypothetical protein V8E54_003591 [Elaphomyces granulatus]
MYVNTEKSPGQQKPPGDPDIEEQDIDPGTDADIDADEDMLFKETVGFFVVESYVEDPTSRSPQSAYGAPWQAASPSIWWRLLSDPNGADDESNSYVGRALLSLMVEAGQR